MINILDFAFTCNNKVTEKKKRFVVLKKEREGTQAQA